MKTMRVILLAAVVTSLAACDLGDPGQHVPEPVVEAWLVAGEPPPPVRMSWTQDVRIPYNPEELALSDAVVVLTQRPIGDGPTLQYSYKESSEPGVYVFSSQGPVTGNAVILSGRTYDLTVQVPDHPTITASTTLPGDFRVLDPGTRQYVYQATDQVEINVTPSEYPGRQAVYIISILALEPRFDSLTPFIRDALYGLAGGEEFNPDDLDLTELENVREQNSPPLNEANWETNADGSLKLKMPWFFVAFYGENRITASAIDDNMWKYFLQVNAQQGNGGLAPGEIPNVQAGVVNGQGVFGSLTRVRETVEIVRQ